MAGPRRGRRDDRALEDAGAGARGCVIRGDTIHFAMWLGKR